ncbi:MAG: spermidine/putrescine transporter permease [Ilumatobacteraceae bacterium]|nr:spermidine/putrescine transporter permease [Ilumatobacteraceae bacterium]
MRLSLLSRLGLRGVTVIGLVFLYVPLVVVVILAFNKADSTLWPPTGWTLDWWRQAWHTSAPKNAFVQSVEIASAATAIALVLGTLAAFAMSRFSFFGKSAISYLLVLPIALPGIVTAVALKNTFLRRIDLGFVSFKVGFGVHSIIIAHSTFCIVVTYNNVVARLRRSSPNLLEASADLGAHGLRTFWSVTFPLVRSALVAGGILAFALSFDEIVVTSFTAGPGDQTLPQWILNSFGRSKGVPVTNVMATVVMALSIPLAWLAQRLSDSTESIAGRR